MLGLGIPGRGQNETHADGETSVASLCITRPNLPFRLLSLFIVVELG